MAYSRSKDRYRWDRYESPEAVIEGRREALDKFVEDFAAPVKRADYVAAALPSLPFESDSFGLVLCSHLLFLYSEDLDLPMHVVSLKEMLRVGHEVRVFPLLDMDGRPSRHVDPVIEALRESAEVERVSVPFEFQLGATQMLRLKREPTS